MPLDGDPSDIFIIDSFFFFLLHFLFFFFVIEDPLTNIGTTTVLEVLLLAGDCLALALALVLGPILILLRLGALGSDVAFLTTIVVLDSSSGVLTLG